MKMSIARALREKNRLNGEIERLWKIFQDENSALEPHKRTADIEQTFEMIEQYSDKLVELKTKIGNANSADHLRRIHLLDETKNRLAKLSATDGSEDPEERFDRKIERTAIFNDEALLVMRRKLQSEANRLQDQIDEFNAETTIEFNSPLN